MAKEPKKLIANNKKVYHDYFLLEKYEAGISLACFATASSIDS